MFRKFILIIHWSNFDTMKARHIFMNVQKTLQNILDSRNDFKAGQIKLFSSNDISDDTVTFTIYLAYIRQFY